MDERVKQLADDHWKYVAEVVEIHEEGLDVIEKCKFHYKTAFIHGYKHGVEDMVARPDLSSDKLMERLADAAYGGGS